MNVIFNIWFSKWKKLPPQALDTDWDKCMNEALRIMEQGDQYPIVKHLMISFIYELAARIRGEYTETEKNKLMELIRKSEEKDG